MATKQKTVAELKDEIFAKGRYNDFKAIMISMGHQDLVTIFVLVDHTAKYAAGAWGQLISFKRYRDGYSLADENMNRRLNTINEHGQKATGEELYKLHNLMTRFLKREQDEKKDEPVKQNKQSFNRVVFFHDACEPQHFELGEISLQEAIEAYCDEFSLEDDDIKDIQVLFYNESDLKRIEKKVAYKVLD